MKVANYTAAEKRKFAKKLRKAQTPAERAMWGLVFFGFRPQRITPAGYIGDWYCKRLGICVELDGAYHRTRATRKHDKARDKHHRQYRILTVRLRNEDALNDRFYAYFKICYLTICWQVIKWWW